MTNPGITSHPLYETWRTIRKRCHDKRNKDYPHYGGRGIRMCEEWRTSYEAFYNWAMSHGYKRGLTVDRICNHRGYSPSNCRLVSRKAQAYNRSTNTHITYMGEVHTLQEWSEKLGIPKNTIAMRVARGWTMEKALSTPVKKSNKKGAEAP